MASLLAPGVKTSRTGTKVVVANAGVCVTGHHCAGLDIATQVSMCMI